MLGMGTGAVGAGMEPAGAAMGNSHGWCVGRWGALPRTVTSSPLQIPASLLGFPTSGAGFETAPEELEPGAPKTALAKRLCCPEPFAALVERSCSSGCGCVCGSWAGRRLESRQPLGSERGCDAPTGDN